MTLSLISTGLPWCQQALSRGLFLLDPHCGKAVSWDLLGLYGAEERSGMAGAEQSATPSFQLRASPPFFAL